MMTVSREEALESALRTFRHFEHQPYKGDDSNRINRHFGSFGEMVIGESLMRLREPFLELLNRSDKDGKIDFNGVSIIFTKPDPAGMDNFVFTAKIYSNETPLFRFLLKDGERHDGTPFGNFEISVLDPQDPGYLYPERIASADISYADEEGPEYSMGFGEISDFGRFIDAMNAVRPLAAFIDLPEDDFKDMETIVRRGRAKHYQDLLAHDGGIAGDLALLAAKTIQDSNFKKVMHWLKDVLPEVHKAEHDQGFIWGEKYLNSNDLDDHSCMIPTADNRVAVFHLNTSLFALHNSYIASAKVDEGNVQSIDIYALKSIENLIQSVKDFQGLSLADEPVVSYDFRTDELKIPAGIEETGIFRSMAFYMNYDRELFVEGEMARRGRDAKAKTDFDEAFGPFDDYDADDDIEGGPSL